MNDNCEYWQTYQRILDNYDKDFGLPHEYCLDCVHYVECETCFDRPVEDRRCSQCPCNGCDCLESFDSRTDRVNFEPIRVPINNEFRQMLEYLLNRTLKQYPKVPFGLMEDFIDECKKMQ